jgi:hypothetical protein
MQRARDNDYDDTQPPQKKQKTVTLTKTLHYTNANLFNNKLYSDFSIVFKSGIKLYAHKTIICQQSEFFRACFSSGMIETENNIVEIDAEEDEELFTILIKALYTEELTFTKDMNISALVQLAEKYMFSSWLGQLVNYLEHNITERNIFDCMNLNLEKYDGIKQAIQRHVNNSSEKILNQKLYLKWEAEQFEKMLQMMISKENVAIGLDCVHNWIEQDEESRAAYSYTLTKLVREAGKQPP